ncbi:MAG: hypothetical protein CL521_01790 [Actinobacteria bacterium]|nr:hypothetical protein [Actinomycetota bacterium]
MSTAHVDLTHDATLTHRDCLAQFIKLGYQRVEMVLEAGDIAVRGAIIDIYPVNQTHPIRIEFELDHIDRLCTFEPQTQLSITALKKTCIKPFTKNTLITTAIQPTSMNTSLISSLSIGDLVVHEHFGIGRFNGLTRLVTASIEGEYVWLQYQENASVYVPLNKLGLLSLYSNQDAPVSLNNLNDRKWAKRTQAAKKATQELVDDIFLVQKIRHLKRGTAFSPDTDLQLDFELQFPHPLTPDQRSAIAEIKSQMESIRPMDHLLCGDVGFGKTEVFLRAAFKAIQDRKQVAILVPTTILADQHYQHIVDRFSGFDCRIAQLSRFSSNDEKRTLISALKSHQIDLVIGTHRLIQKDIQFADLGLIIIDEEQRFGVYHKEKLKSFKHCVDVLSVTATPIPRTLYLALTGTKTISKIESPPLGRQLIKLKLHPFSEQAVLAAIDDELNRKGQVYYVINHIDRLYQTRKFLLKHRPLARIEIIHSQVPKCRLKRIMQQVYRQEIDILLSTTIIENGIDIPTVNTIIIIDAQNFGLSQIHQLKGRVGRRDTQGIAY